MFYIPGAQYRHDSECPSGSSYSRFAEAQGKRTFTTNAADRRRDEALSRNLANSLVFSLRSHKPGIKVHSAGDPIRNVIRRKQRAILRALRIAQHRRADQGAP